MRYVTVRRGTGTVAGQADGDTIRLLDVHDVGELLRRGLQSASFTGEALAIRDAELAPVVPRPEKIICLGRNYEAHAREMGRELPTHPTLFAKFHRSLIGPRDDIWLPTRESSQVDWEAELAVVIGREIRRASAEEAAAAIAGFTIMNDVSVRDWQSRTPEWLQGKTWEHTTPLGPALVTPDEVDWARDLEVRCDVDGEEMQCARTSDLIFRPVEVVRYLSRICTLVPGDVIATGTPGGVGAAREPQRFLRSGQVVVTAIDGLGELVNRCVDDPTAA